MVDDGKARTIHHISDIGMQAGAPPINLNAKSHCDHGGSFHAQLTGKSGADKRGD